MNTGPLNVLQEKTLSARQTLIRLASGVQRIRAKAADFVLFVVFEGEDVRG